MNHSTTPHPKKGPSENPEKKESFGARVVNAELDKLAMKGDFENMNEDELEKYITDLDAAIIEVFESLANDPEYAEQAEEIKKRLEILNGMRSLLTENQTLLDEGRQEDAEELAHEFFEEHARHMLENGHTEEEVAAFIQDLNTDIDEQKALLQIDSDSEEAEEAEEGGGSYTLSAIDFGIGVTPVAGGLWDMGKAMVGYDLDGRKLGWGERGILYSLGAGFAVWDIVSFVGVIVPEPVTSGAGVAGLSASTAAKTAVKATVKEMTERAAVGVATDVAGEAAEAGFKAIMKKAWKTGAVLKETAEAAVIPKANDLLSFAAKILPNSAKGKKGAEAFKQGGKFLANHKVVNHVADEMVDGLVKDALKANLKKSASRAVTGALSPYEKYRLYRKEKKFAEIAREHTEKRRELAATLDKIMAKQSIEQMQKAA